MPNWGLTDQQRQLEPWGIPKAMLAPCKTVTDPVHGDIYLTRLEALVVDSPPMQRLRRVRQLGTTHLVYPGATHSRLSHALGTLRAAQDLLDAVWNSPTNPQAKDVQGNLLAEWAEAGRDYLDMEFAKATVLARLGALMHDLCHVPLGHTIEDDLQILTPHDGNEERFLKLWSGLEESARLAIEEAPGLLDELRVLIISKDGDAEQFKSEYPFVGDIVGNTICADLIDYIRRDHHNSGLPLALGTRFMDSFFVVPSGHPYYAKRMVIGIERDGRLRSDIVSELVKYLRYRYELTERVLTHHAKTAADAMLGKMLELWHDDLWALEAEGLHREARDHAEGSSPASSSLSVNASVTQIREVLDSSNDGSAETSAAAEARVRAKIEHEFVTRSDDGLLEYLATTAPLTGTPRGQAAGKLANDLLDRNLYKILGHAAGREDQAIAAEVYKKFAANPDDRRKLEKAAADFAGIRHGWEVVVWLPGHKMRLKVADVLVKRGNSIAPLSQVEPTSREIVEQHQRLWAVTVYAPAIVRDDSIAADAVLAYLGDKTGLSFRRPDGSMVPSRQALAVDRVLSKLQGELPLRSELMSLAAAASDESREGTFDSLVTAVWESGIENNLIDPTIMPTP